MNNPADSSNVGGTCQTAHEATEGDVETHLVVHRGSFVIPGQLFDEGRDSELAYFFATHMPYKGTVARRLRLENGSVRIDWRRIEVVWPRA